MRLEAQTVAGSGSTWGAAETASTAVVKVVSLGWATGCPTRSVTPAPTSRR